MDADDIMHPDRLYKQFNYLQSNRNIDVLGTSVLMYSNNNSNSSASPSTSELFNLDADELTLKYGLNVSVRLVEHPTESVHIAWSMFFNCCIVHPSVIVKRSLFISNQYDSKFPHVEDYSFWLKLIGAIQSENQIVFSNLNSKPPLLILRKHQQSISSIHSSIQRQSAFEASSHYLMALFIRCNITVNYSVDSLLKIIRILQFPKLLDEESIVLVQDAYEILEKLELAFNRIYPSSTSSIRDYTNDRMGELVAIAMSKCPNQHSITSKLWNQWLSRNPTSQIFSLLSIAGNKNNNNSNSNNSSSSTSGDVMSILSGFSGNNSSTTTKNKQYTVNGIRIICFSKDRAFQLSEFIRTFYKYLQLKETESFKVEMKILYTYSETKFKESYRLVQEQYPMVEFIEEENDFAGKLVELAIKNNQLRYIMYSVDDILYYDSVNLDQYCSDLESEKDALGFYTKMFPKITYCHTADQQIKIPSQLQQGRPSSFCKWNRNESDCEKEWNYPFDLCSTIYRSIDSELIVNSIIKYYGVKGLLNPIMSVITINRTQDLFCNRVYQSEENSEDDKFSINQLDQLIYQELPSLSTSTLEPPSLSTSSPANVQMIKFCDDCVISSNCSSTETNCQYFQLNTCSLFVDNCNNGPWTSGRWIFLQESEDQGKVDYQFFISPSCSNGSEVSPKKQVPFNFCIDGVNLISNPTLLFYAPNCPDVCYQGVNIIENICNQYVNVCPSPKFLFYSILMTMSSPNGFVEVKIYSDSNCSSYFLLDSFSMYTSQTCQFNTPSVINLSPPQILAPSIQSVSQFGVKGGSITIKGMGFGFNSSNINIWSYFGNTSMIIWKFSLINDSMIVASMPETDPYNSASILITRTDLKIKSNPHFIFPDRNIVTNSGY
eukprot:gene3592-4474_t